MAKKDEKRLYKHVPYVLVDDQTIQREIKNLIAIDYNYPKYVVIEHELPAGNAYKGNRQIHLLDFLKKIPGKIGSETGSKLNKKTCSTNRVRFF